MDAEAIRRGEFAQMIFRSLPVIETPRLILRPMTRADAGDMFEYASDPEVSRYTVWDAHGSVDDALKFLACAEENYRAGEPENWGVVYRADGKFIGTCGYFYWDIWHYKAEIHYAMSRAYHGKGLMTEAVEAALDFGFTAMGLNRVEAGCMPANTASERLLQKAGMTYEGVKRAGIFSKGIFNDLKVYAILRREWETRRRASQKRSTA